MELAHKDAKGDGHLCNDQDGFARYHESRSDVDNRLQMDRLSRSQAESSGRACTHLRLPASRRASNDKRLRCFKSSVDRYALGRVRRAHLVNMAATTSQALKGSKAARRLPGNWAGSSERLRLLRADRCYPGHRRNQQEPQTHPPTSQRSARELAPLRSAHDRSLRPPPKSYMLGKQHPISNDAAACRASGSPRPCITMLGPLAHHCSTSAYERNQESTQGATAWKLWQLPTAYAPVHPSVAAQHQTRRRPQRTAAEILRPLLQKTRREAG